MLHPTLGSREVSSSNDKEAPPGIVVHHTKEGVKGGKKRHKRRPQETTTTTNHNDDNDGKVGGSSMRHISTTAHGDKHQARPPMDHFKSLLEEACPNHTYLVRHKLKDYGMRRSFMTSGSLT
jgi:hypothetical protein